MNKKPRQGDHRAPRDARNTPDPRKRGPDSQGSNNRGFDKLGSNKRGSKTPAPAPTDSEASRAWSLLPEPYRSAVLRLGFASPTPIQKAALAKALAGESFRALAPTGTGKTLVYLIAAWQRSAERGPRRQALILLPTRELAYQVSQMILSLEPDSRREAAMAIGGHPKESQLRRLREPWSVLIATPGRLLELLDEQSIELRAVDLIVLDEFDKLIGMGFQEQIESILGRADARAQKLLLSATDHDADVAAQPGKTKIQDGPGLAIDALGLASLPLISVAREAGRVMEEVFFFLKSNKKKSDLLLQELGAVKGQSIVFVANREKANHLNGLLRMKGLGVRALHGHLPQEERAEAYAEFRKGRFRILVATDLASRGLDMPEVDLIVNYDLPKHYKDYVHRTGRAARRGRAGRCVSFAGPDEYLPMRNLENEFPGPIPAHPAFAQRDRWFIDAKRNHETLVKREERKERIRKEQGLDG